VSFAFLRPPLGYLGATYDDHIWLIGKKDIGNAGVAKVECEADWLTGLADILSAVF